MKTTSLSRLSRREFIKTLSLGAVTLTLPSWVINCQSRRPYNVLFIAVDDLNDWANCLGGRPNVITPNIDKLAAKGVLFTNAHCSAPACNPSRTSLLSGIRPSTSGVYHNRHHWRNSPALQKAIMLPAYFKQHGYRVLGGGKIFHCLSWIQKDYGFDENDFSIWDEYFPSKKRSLPDSIWPEEAEIDEFGTVTWPPMVGRNTKGRPPYFFDWGPIEEKGKKMADTQVVDWAISQLKKNHEQPFFLAVGIYRPHIPWFVPKKYYDLYPLNKITLPPIQENDLEDCSPVAKKWVRRSWHQWILKNKLWKQAVQAYLASISFSDAQVSRLLTALEESPYARHTVIVLWSDHGMHIGEKEHWEKFTLWEESTRVPLILVVPGLTQPNSRCSRPVSLLDIYPTLVDVCQLPPNNQLEGRSLRPLLRNPSAPWPWPALSTWGKNNHALRTERWRYIHYFDGSEELYDHDSDPDEYYNLAQQPEYQDLKEKLKKWLPSVNADPVE